MNQEIAEPAPAAGSRRLEGADVNVPDGSTNVEALAHVSLTAWQSGKPRSLESLMHEVAAGDWERALRALLIVELRYRRQQGDSPAASEFLMRFPDGREIIEEVFALMPAPARSASVPTSQRSANDAVETAAPQSANRSRSKPSATTTSKAAARDEGDEFEEYEIVDDDFDEPVANEKPRSRNESRTKPETKEADRKRRSAAPTDSVKRATSDSQPVRRPRRDAEADDDDDEFEVDWAAAEKPSKPSSKRKSKSRPAEDVDEWGDLDGAMMEALPSSRPKKSKKDDASTGKSAKKTKKKRSSGEALPPTEFLIPLVLTIVGLVLLTTFSITMPWADISPAVYVPLRLGYALFTVAFTIAGLFAAAAVLGTGYGYFDKACLKVAAIVLTQGWIELILDRLQVMWVGQIILAVITVAMFMAFFELDYHEVMQSMFVVRIIGWISHVMLIAAFVAYMVSQKGGAEAELDLDPDHPHGGVHEQFNGADESDDDGDDEEMGAGRPGGKPPAKAPAAR